MIFNKNSTPLSRYFDVNMRLLLLLLLSRYKEKLEGNFHIYQLFISFVESKTTFIRIPQKHLSVAIYGN